MIGILMNHELEMVWKQSWPNLRHYHSIFLEGLGKTTKTSVRIADLWVEI
jgi:hypothetical protein